MNEIHLNSSVALNVDLPHHGLKRGDVGTVIEVLEDDVFEVEFQNRDGRAWELAVLKTGQLMPLSSVSTPYRMTA